MLSEQNFNTLKELYKKIFIFDDFTKIDQEYYRYLVDQTDEDQLLELHTGDWKDIINNALDLEKE